MPYTKSVEPKEDCDLGLSSVLQLLGHCFMRNHLLLLCMAIKLRKTLIPRERKRKGTKSFGLTRVCSVAWWRINRANEPSSCCLWSSSGLTACQWGKMLDLRNAANESIIPGRNAAYCDGHGYAGRRSECCQSTHNGTKFQHSAKNMTALTVRDGYGPGKNTQG